MPRQYPCKQCGKLTASDPNGRHHLCKECDNIRRHPPSTPTTTTSPIVASSSSTSSSTIFNRPSGCIDQLTKVQRAAIITLYAEGMLVCDIAYEIPCSENTVSLWIDRWKQEHSLEDNERCGRPRCTTDDTDQDIMIYSNNNVDASPKDITRELQLSASSRTVRRRLDEIGLISCIKRNEHNYTHENIFRRISFAEGYSNWSEQDWSRVIFSDETHFYLGHHGREYVQRPVGAALDSKYTNKTEVLEGTVSLWGCICAGGLGHAELYVDSLDARKYQSILALNLVSSAHQFWPKGQWWFQQDNWSVHTASTSQAWFHNHGIDLIEWPAWSSDLNPIEDLWNDLKRRVYIHHPQTMQELEHWIGIEWQATDLNFISHICHSMPRRLQLLLANHGHKISY